MNRQGRPTGPGEAAERAEQTFSGNRGLAIENPHRMARHEHDYCPVCGGAFGSPF